MKKPKKVICFVGEKVILGIGAAASAWCFWSGMQKANDPTSTETIKTKTRCFFKEDGLSGTIRTTQTEATQETTEVKITKTPIKNEWASTGLAFVLGASFAASTILMSKK